MSLVCPALLSQLCIVDFMVSYGKNEDTYIQYRLLYWIPLVICLISALRYIPLLDPKSFHCSLERSSIYCSSEIGLRLTTWITTIFFTPVFSNRFFCIRLAQGLEVSSFCSNILEGTLKVTRAPGSFKFRCTFSYLYVN